MLKPLVKRGLFFSIEKGVFTPIKWGRWTLGVISPTRNQLTTKTRFWVQRALSQSLPGKLEVLSGNQKEKKKKSTLGLNISPHPQTTPLYVHFSFVHVGWGHRHNHPCQVSSQSVQQFRLPRGSKFTISDRLGEWLLQQCYALTCYTVSTVDDFCCLRVTGIAINEYRRGKLTMVFLILRDNSGELRTVISRKVI